MNQDTKNNLKKIGLFSLVAFCAGDTIGAGIFSTLPFAVNLVGPGIAWAWVAAIAMVIFVSIPSIIPSSNLPCPSAGYTLPSRLMSPYLGFFELINMMNYVVILGLLSLFFSDYVAILIPGLPTLPIAIGVIIVFWIVNMLGVDAGTTVQNVIVVVLICTLISFIVVGVPNMSAEHVTVTDVLAPTGMTITAFFACLALCYNCLGGCFTGCLVLGDRIKNPRRNLILGGCITAVLVGVIYCLISIVTLGIADWHVTLPPLGDIAKLIMPKALWYVFMIGGALAAMASTINAMVLSVGYRIDTMAEDGIFPAVFNKTNRFGTKTLSLSVTPIIGIVLVLLNPPLDSLISACSVLAVLGAILRLWPLVFLPKRYPHTYKRGAIVLSKPIALVWVIAASILCLVVSISGIITTPGAVWLVMLAVLVVMYAYFLVRIKFMKAKGQDIFAKMKAPYPEWEEKEAAYRLEDENAATTAKVDR